MSALLVSTQASALPHTEQDSSYGATCLLLTLRLQARYSSILLLKREPITVQQYSSDEKKMRHATVAEKQGCCWYRDTSHAAVGDLRGVYTDSRCSALLCAGVRRLDIHRSSLHTRKHSKSYQQQRRTYLRWPSSAPLQPTLKKAEVERKHPAPTARKPMTILVQR